MKGIVFTEFLDLVEEKFGLEIVDEIIEKSDLESKGAYTTVGTYKYVEMVALLSNLSALTKINVNDLLKIYGLHFFDVLVKNYGSILNMYKSPLELLSSIEAHIHVEVRKLYPDAELPTFEIIEQTSNGLILMYYSSRCMYAFAHGLIEKTFEHYNQKAEVTFELLEKNGSKVKFEIVEI